MTTETYHVIYAKERALTACGNSEFMKCQYCKTYDDPAKMSIRKAKRQAYHRECHARHMRELRAKQKV